MAKPTEADFERIDKAANFNELFAAYRRYYRTRVPANAARRIFQLAEAIAASFPMLELWDHLAKVLEWTMVRYEPLRGAFSTFFASALERRLRQARAKTRKKKRLKHAAEVEYANRKRPAQIGSRESFRRWARIILDQTIRRLDPTARAFVRMRMGGATVKDIAVALGLKPGSLSNRFGGGRMVSMLQEETRQLVGELSADVRGLFVQHLLHDARLSPKEVERLLGGLCWPRQSAPIVSEGSVLARLGWASQISEEKSRIPPHRHEFSESGRLIYSEAVLAS